MTARTAGRPGGGGDARVQRGDGAPDRAGDGRARHGRDRRDGRPAAVVPEDVRGEPVLARAGRAGRHRRVQPTGSGIRNGTGPRSPRCSAPRRVSWPGRSACSTRWRWCGSSSTSVEVTGRRAGRAGRRGRAARGGADLRPRDRLQRGAGVRADRRGARRVGRPAGGPGGGFPGARRTEESLHSWAVGAELVVLAGHGDGRHRRRRGRRR